MIKAPHVLDTYAKAKGAECEKIIMDFWQKLNNYLMGAPWFEAFNEECKTRFQGAPASGYKLYHGAWEGGLEVHCAMVYAIAAKTAKANGILTDDADQLLVQASLLHDLGKIGDVQGISYYLSEKEDWWREKRGRLYNRNKKLDYLYHEDLSLLWCSHLKVPMTKQLYSLIRYHNIFETVPGSHPVMNVQDPYLMCFQFADYFTTKIYQI